MTLRYWNSPRIFLNFNSICQAFLGNIEFVLPGERKHKHEDIFNEKDSGHATEFAITNLCLIFHSMINQQSLNTGLFCLSPQWSNEG